MLKEVSIEIIRKCPNCCVHCSSMSSKLCTEIIPLEKYKEIVLDAKKLGAKTICLSGGEPFLHKDIIEMAKYTYECGLECIVYTSGITFDKYNQQSSLEKSILEQISRYTSKLIFNIEAGTEKTYDRIMGTTKCFEKMKQSVVCAVNLGICAEAHFVPMVFNADEIEAVIDLCKTLHISKLSFLRLVLHGRAVSNQDQIALSEDQNRKLKEQLKSIQNRADFAIRVGVPLSLDDSCHKCEAARGKLNIKYDGNVFPCEVFKNISLNNSVGPYKPNNIYVQSLLEIYNHSEYLQRIRKLYNTFSDSYPSKCETCIGQHLIATENGGEEK